MNWQDIATVPKDGTSVLLFIPTHREGSANYPDTYIVDEWVGWKNRPTGWFNGMSPLATHWCPLEPPGA